MVPVPSTIQDRANSFADFRNVSKRPSLFERPSIQASGTRMSVIHILSFAEDLDRLVLTLKLDALVGWESAK